MPTPGIGEVLTEVYIPNHLRCGSGLSGEVLTEAGHHWVGIDISQYMLGKPFLVCTQQLKSIHDYA